MEFQNSAIYTYNKRREGKVMFPLKILFILISFFMISATFAKQTYVRVLIYNDTDTALTYITGGASKGTFRHDPPTTINPKTYSSKITTRTEFTEGGRVISTSIWIRLTYSNKEGSICTITASRAILITPDHINRDPIKLSTENCKGFKITPLQNSNKPSRITVLFQKA